MITRVSWLIKENSEGFSLPVFLLESNNLSADVRLIQPHFVLPFVGLNEFDQPQLRVSVPDINLLLGIISPFTEAQQKELDNSQRIFNSSILILTQGHETFDLSRYTTDVILDFSGELGRAVHLASQGYHLEAIQKLDLLLQKSEGTPPTGLYYELGRCYMALGNLEQALQFHAQEINNCQSIPSEDLTDLIPAASMPFNSQAVIFKKQRRFDEAVASFQTALKLRPNYFEALVSYITLMAGNVPAEQVLNLLARAFTCQPRHSLIQQIIPGVAHLSGCSPQELLKQVQDLSQKIDLMQPSI